jgi:hypothetical protein
LVAVEDRWLEDIESRLKTDGASVVTETLKDELVKQLKEN